MTLLYDEHGPTLYRCPLMLLANPAAVEKRRYLSRAVCNQCHTIRPPAGANRADDGGAVGPKESDLGLRVSARQR